MPFRKSWQRRRRHSSYCSSITEIAVGAGGNGGGGSGVGHGAGKYASTSLSGRSGNTTITTSGGSVSYAVSRSSVGSIDVLGATNAAGVGGAAPTTASRRCCEQPQHFVVMDIINEDKVEV